MIDLNGLLISNLRDTGSDFACAMTLTAASLISV